MEQARALEAQGESAKALAIYQHVLPHLEGMPAIKADLSLKAGDIMLKLGNTTGALGMYEAAGTQCALHGSSKGALTVAAKIQQAAPSRTDVLLSLAGQMVKHGHAGPAVDVLIQHAKQANLNEMLQELQPLAGRPSEDVRPLVEMLLDQPTPSSPAAPPPAAPAKRSSIPKAPAPPADDLTLEPMSLEDQLSSLPMPRASSAPPPSPTYAPPPAPHLTPPPQPAFMGPPAPPPAAPAGPPSYMPPPPPMAAPPVSDLSLDLSPPLPMSARETAAINLRASQVMREAIEEEPPPPRRPSLGQRRPLVPPPPPSRGGGSGKLKWVAIPVVLVAVAAALVYFGVLPGSLGKRMKGVIPTGKGATAAASDSVRSSPVAGQPKESTAVRPDSFRFVAGPPTVRGAPAAAPVGDDSGKQPPVKIEGLAVVDFNEVANGFRVVQRQESGRYLVLTGRPLADTIGEPAVGEVRIDNLPGDSTVAVTNFEGYVVTVRGVITSAALQSLLLQLVSRPH
jgi:hypothetical protein